MANNSRKVNMGFLAKMHSVPSLRTFLTKFYPYNANEFKLNFNHMVNSQKMPITPEHYENVLNTIDDVANGASAERGAVQLHERHQNRFGGNKRRKATRKRRTGHKRKSANKTKRIV